MHRIRFKFVREIETEEISSFVTTCDVHAHILRHAQSKATSCSCPIKKLEQDDGRTNAGLKEQVCCEEHNKQLDHGRHAPISSGSHVSHAHT